MSWFRGITGQRQRQEQVLVTRQELPQIQDKLGILSEEDARNISKTAGDYFAHQAKLQELQREQKQILSEVSQLLLESGQKKMAEAERKAAEAERKSRLADHNLMVNALGLMIHGAVGAEKVPQAKAVADECLKSYEDQHPQEWFEFVESKSCMRLTSNVSQVILDVFKKVPCTSPNLTKFKDEIDPTALRAVLSNAKISKVTFARSAQEAAVLEVARAVARTRSLEISFA
jgi:hypothetical protein